MKFQEFKEKIEEWATVRKFKSGTTELRQQVKGLEEIGEFMLALEDLQEDSGSCYTTISQKEIEVMKEAGDIAVCIIISNMLSSYSECIGGEPRLHALYGREDICQIANELLNSNYTYALAALAGVLNDLDLDFNECLNLTWEKIKDRKGMWVQGFYVKYESLTTEQKREFDRCNA